MKRKMQASKKVQMKEVQKVAAVCVVQNVLLKPIMARLSPSCAASPFGRGRSGPTPSTVIGPLHAPVEMPSSVPSAISTSIVSSIPSAKASSTSVAVSGEEKC